MQPYERPIWWSVSKVFASSLVAELEDAGRIDVTRPVEDYVPDLKGTEFGGVTVRNVLDMASGVDCSDGAYARGTCYYEYEATLDDAVRTAHTPDTPYAFLRGLHAGRWAAQGTGFDYSGVNTFVLGWVVEQVTGLRLHDAVSRSYWTRIGAEHDAAFFSGSHGIALTHGGFMATPRDMARFGLLFTPSWRTVSDRPVISAGCPTPIRASMVGATSASLRVR